MFRTTALRLTALLAAAPAFAGTLEQPVADTIVIAPQPVVVAPTPRLIFTLRGGVAVSPEYFGSDDFEVGPDIGFSLNYANLGGREFGSTEPGYRPLGFGLTGAFRYIGERTADDSPELSGLADIDDAVELGLGARYSWENFEVFGNVRQGFGGHEGVVGDLGADVLFNPTDRLTFSAGPRVFIGDSEYADTYFGVPAATGTFAAYEAEGGVLSAGVELGMTYDFSDRWGLEGALRYDVLQNDAADSPITANDDQVSIRLGVTRRFSLNF